MKAINKSYYLAALLIFGVLLWLAYLAANSFLHIFGEWSSVIQMTVVISAGLIISAVTVSHAIKFHSKRRQDTIHTLRLIRLYGRVLADLSPDSKLKEDTSANEQEMVLLARKSVIDAYWNRKQHDDNDSRDWALERLITEMRKDIGHRDLPLSLTAAVDMLTSDAISGEAPVNSEHKEGEFISTNR